MKSNCKFIRIIVLLFMITSMISEVLSQSNVKAMSKVDHFDSSRHTYAHQRNLSYVLNDRLKSLESTVISGSSIVVSGPSITVSGSALSGSSIQVSPDPIPTQTPFPVVTPTSKHSDYVISDSIEVKNKKKKHKKKKSKVYSAPPGKFKSYMPYRKSSGKSIFNRNSPQYRLQKKAHTANNGIRKVDDRYCVAVGSKYTKKIGTELDIEMKSGKVIKAILADQKSDKDTDPTNSYHLCDNSVVEFIVDTRKLKRAAKRSGNIASVGRSFSGSISHIRVYK